jgi:energy-coupling factor transport system permease protein
MVELSRDLNFGQYINNGSALTRLDPRTKLLCAVLLIALVSYVANFSAFAICILYCIVLQWASHITFSYVMRGFKLIFLFTIPLFIFEVIFYTPPTLHITLLWHWWIISISWESIIFSAVIALRVFLLYYLASMIMFTTSLIDLTNGLEALLSPLQKVGLPAHKFVMVLVIAFKFVPIFVAEAERLTKAQAARGVRFDKGNFIQRALKLGSLLIPLFISGFQRAEALSIAMEARCYGGDLRGWKRSKRRVLHFSRQDALTLILTIVVCIVAVVANFTAPF